MVERIRLQDPIIADAIEALADGYCYLYPVEHSEINQGLCEDFAADVVALFPGAELLWIGSELDLDDFFHPSIVHAVARYEGRFYDADCPEGVERWEDLPIFSSTN